MASRTDLTFEYNDDPRVAEIAAPSTEITMQDLVDTFRDAEYSWQGNTFKKLLNASGKEDLGGGVQVGITAALQNILLSFEGRTTPAETGTVTSNPGSLVAGRDQFVDTSADFVTAEVARGSLVINFTDRSIAEVITVDDLNTLTTKTLVNGIGNTYDAADVYHVFNVTQCIARAGNLTAVDALLASISAILPTAFTQVVVEKSSSATLVESGVSGLTAEEALQLNELHGQVRRSVYIDTEAIPAGNGYQQTPFNTFTAAVDFAETNGIKNLVLLADATADRQLKNFIFDGVGDPTLDVNGQDVNRSEFHDLHLTGSINPVSEIHCHNCELENGLTGVHGDFFNCGFAGVITLAGNSNTTMIDCYSTIGGLSRPTIDINGGGAANVSIRSYRGGLNIGGVDTAGDEVTVSLSEGKLTLLNTNTAGVISVRGVSQFTDDSAGSTVDTTGLLDTFKQSLLVKLLMNRMETDPSTGIMTIYDDDDVTPLLTGNIFEDVLAAQIYRGRGMERRDRLT